MEGMPALAMTRLLDSSIFFRASSPRSAEMALLTGGQYLSRSRSGPSYQPLSTSLVSASTRIGHVFGTRTRRMNSSISVRASSRICAASSPRQLRCFASCSAACFGVAPWRRIRPRIASAASSSQSAFSSGVSSSMWCPQRWGAYEEKPRRQGGRDKWSARSLNGCMFENRNLQGFDLDRVNAQQCTNLI